MKVYTRSYEPFRCGGNCEGLIATEVEEFERIKLTEEHAALVIKNPVKKLYHVFLESCGALVVTAPTRAKAVTEVMKDARAADSTVLAGVDSGSLIIMDPCYIESEWKSKHEAKPTGIMICLMSDIVTDSSQDECFRMRGNEDHGGQLDYKLGHPGLGVVFSSGFDDGTYEVIAHYCEYPNWGVRIERVEIVMIDEKQEDVMTELVGPLGDFGVEN